ncbi:YjbE family putative metal transport protein [Candidatus Profftella armatura (Diaphorina cf. continua)]|uniref:YjbE family putative metal transport protein n=1 Tax=Candidatus Profftella armatura (Diaphorina cf. continua) TaxID=2661583 RepID=A0A7R7AB42_9PROT|nr:YjbE family putative metal transport protein [Candidatus Profftella armatura (Diaphorina cf. continua)]BCG49760.1 YjbE family putative metal transport protein [Candidatus Profftella armatura (Diaphorina cf. continua)]
MTLLTTSNGISIIQIILIDILLGGDNAIIIALACRNLPPKIRVKGVIWGTFGAIAIRIILVIFSINLLNLKYIKIIGGLFLSWISIKLLSNNHNYTTITSGKNLINAIKTIIFADLIMSIDNVLAIAGTASQISSKYQMLLVIIGILISIPIIIFGSKLVLILIEKFSSIVILCSILLGYLSGNMIFSDKSLTQLQINKLAIKNISIFNMELHISLPGIIMSTIVVGTGIYLSKNKYITKNDFK